ncbi:G-protein coupled receptor family C group 5 member B-like [Paramormyrops kingsleyae]|uniref:G-protein coupled receptor family C group 5 member B-like n=1 Tax=Paramormyrops kingsleyae TaxID=1676925 RepID=UPI003B96AD8D
MNSGGWRVLRAGEDDRHRLAMAMPSMFPILLILSLVGCSSAEDEAPPRGCGSLLKWPLCNLDAVWGVAVTVAAGVAVLASLVLALVLLCRLRRITEPEARSGVAPLLLLLATICMLCAVSFVYVIERDDSVCIARHSLWGALFVLTMAYQATQGVRLLRRSSFRALAALAIGLAVILGIAIFEWILVIALHPGQPVCDYKPLHIALICLYALALIVAVPMTLACGLANGQPQPTFRIMSLLIMSFTSGIMWGICLARYYRAMKLQGGLSSSNEDQLQAEMLVAQAWLLLLLHAIPEAYICLQPAQQPTDPNDVVPALAPQHRREGDLEAGISLSTRPTVESQGSEFDSSSSAGSASWWNGSAESRPSTSYHVETYELNEMNSNAEPMPSTSSGISKIWFTEASIF